MNLLTTNAAYTKIDFAQFYQYMWLRWRCVRLCFFFHQHLTIEILKLMCPGLWETKLRCHFFHCDSISEMVNIFIGNSIRSNSPCESMNCNNFPFLINALTCERRHIVVCIERMSMYWYELSVCGLVYRENADDLMISVDTVSRSIHHINIVIDLAHRSVNM